MPCYHPVPAWRTPHGVVFSELRRHDILGRVDIPCGQCLGCRLRRAEDWAVRIMHESQMWSENCFVTLTYDNDHLPPGGSLRYADYQAFMRRVRRACADKTVRFFVCGEYGPATNRPHYHAALFNVSWRSEWKPVGKSGSGELFYDSRTVRELWGKGNISVQDLTPQSAAYTARYIVDKMTGDAGVATYGDREPPFCRCSLKPGIGAAWFAKFGADVFPGDLVVMEGERRRVPKYYDRLLRRSKSFVSDRIEYERAMRARSAIADNTDERLAVREVVHKARLSTLRRELE